MESSPRRVFLGRERLPLEAAAEWLAGERGLDMGGSVVALPGARAGRRLAERLARLLGPAWTPPRFVTDGRLSDVLLEPRAHLAGRLVRTLAWERALRELPPATLQRIVARPPAEGDAASWSRLAEEVRRLFGELAAECLDFRGVADGEHRPASTGEALRWSALAEAQERMAAALERAGLADPHLARLAALERGDVAGRIEGMDADVILVGVAQTTELLRRTLELVAGRVTALVFAPEEEARLFDAFGRLEVEPWAGRDVPLPLERWSVVQGPEDQAREALRVLAGWDGRHAAEDVTIGIADAEVAPYLARRLAQARIGAREAAGKPLERTPPARLLAAVAELLATGTFGAFAALCRHPDLEAALRRDRRLEGVEPAELLDEYLARHLPGRAGGDWPGEAPLREPMRRLDAALRGLLGELAQDEARPLSDWTGPARALLEEVYGARELDAEGADRELALALASIGEALAELDACPAGLAPAVGAAEALRRLGRALSAQSIPPAPTRAGAATIELLGWLELALDDAPALVVTGFEEGRVPASVQGDAWLPNDLRRRLCVSDDQARLARDVYATLLLLDSRADVAFVTGRRSAAGDPLRPSRIAFHRPPDEIPARVRHALEGSRRRRVEPALEESRSQRALPRRAATPELERYSVTSFRAYLASPYLFYLQHVLGVESFAHDGRELDPMGFGALAHDALEVLGRDPALRAATDPERIAAALEAELRRLAAGRFGDSPLPALELQVDQLAWRLRAFARVQARRASAGWTVARAEWKPVEPVLLDVDGAPVELRGRIDRVDVHADGRWCVLDYKTGEQGLRSAAAKAHLARDGTWRDLQLPLYVLLARELGAELERPGLPLAGYAALGRTEASIGFDTIEGWDDAVIESALDAAREVVRAVRRGELFDVGRARPHDPVLSALLGQGLLTASPALEGQGDADGEGGAGAEDIDGEDGP